METGTNESYQGMYNQSFPDRCWSPDGKLVFFTTPCKSSIQSYALNLGNYQHNCYHCSKLVPFSFSADSSSVCKLSLPEGCTGSVVLDVFQDVILVFGVSLIRPDQLFIGRFNSEKIDEKPIEWKCLTGKKSLPPTQSLASDVLSVKLAGDMEYEVFKLNKFTVVIV